MDSISTFLFISWRIWKEQNDRVLDNRLGKTPPI